MAEVTPNTPSRQQYLDVRAQHPDAIVFFRMGDFYETFDDDAAVVARELDLILTSRPMGKNQRVPMAGVPHHAAENYIARLVAKGYKIALCEQVSTELVNGLMPREVVRVFTAGTVVEPGDLILGDIDGVVCVPKAHAADVLKGTIKKHEAEAKQMAETKAGTVNRDWVDKALKEAGCEFLE